MPANRSSGGWGRGADAGGKVEEKGKNKKSKAVELDSWEVRMANGAQYYYSIMTSTSSTYNFMMITRLCMCSLQRSISKSKRPILPSFSYNTPPPAHCILFTFSLSIHFLLLPFIMALLLSSLLIFFLDKADLWIMLLSFRLKISRWIALMKVPVPSWLWLFTLSPKSAISCCSIKRILAFPSLIKLVFFAADLYFLLRCCCCLTLQLSQVSSA